MRGLLVLVLLAGCGGPPERSGKVNSGDPMPGTPAGTDPTPLPNPDPAPTVTCKYPAAPYGTDIGRTVAPTLSWQGYVNGSSTLSTFTMADLFDCDGAKKIDVIVVAQAAQWCGVCKSEASGLESKLSGSWSGLNMKYVELVIETASGTPATTTTAKQWRDAYGLDHAAVMADPDFSFAHSGSNSLPVHAIIDPRTMKIIDKPEGSLPYDSTVQQLAAKNHK